MKAEEFLISDLKVLPKMVFTEYAIIKMEAYAKQETKRANANEEAWTVARAKMKDLESEVERLTETSQFWNSKEAQAIDEVVRLQEEVDRLKGLIDLMQCNATINRVLIDDDDFDLEDILELIKD